MMMMMMMLLPPRKSRQLLFDNASIDNVRITEIVDINLGYLQA